MMALVSHRIGNPLWRIAVMTLALMAASFTPTRSTADDTRNTNGNFPNAVDTQSIETLERVSNAFANVAEAVKPSVVHIRAISLNKAMNRELQKMLGSDNVPPVPTTGTGSGIILDREGHIVSNNHVVADARRISVILADGRKFTAKLVGTDPKTDIAVLKIDADRLTPARLGDSDLLRTGQLVLAVGSPFRLGHSVSHGIISAIGRSEESIDVDIPYKNWIQTDAPINPGNSGGPLVNMRGEVVGISVAIATESGGHQGVGFAIPANNIARIASMLKSGEEIVRGYLGVQIKPVDAGVAEAYGLPEVSGVWITGVIKESPAEKAGLRDEDIVLSVGNRSVRSQADLQEAIATHRPGSDVEMKVWRTGRMTRLTVEVGTQPDGFSTRAGSRSFRADSPRRRSTENEDADFEKTVRSLGRFGDLGFEAETYIEPSEADDGRKIGQEGGVMITRVDPTSEAYECGLRAGQRILRINGQPVKNILELQDRLTPEAVARGVRIKYRIDDEDDYLVLRIR